ncbi:hypothetical protein AVEN_133227-1 [Araneus ventricosus]|uniref:Uncharacterized protein n=1 Tax=Araneus ventricosus TaxID=182803 RepID=A0A4Y2J3U5_ARAVE|nr:hypothetical protein AVEN_133227-1 [Araneus ventricosus]
MGICGPLQIGHQRLMHQPIPVIRDVVNITILPFVSSKEVIAHYLSDDFLFLCLRYPPEGPYGGHVIFQENFRVNRHFCFLWWKPSPLASLELMWLLVWFGIDGGGLYYIANKKIAAFK